MKKGNNKSKKKNDFKLLAYFIGYSTALLLAILTSI